MAGKTASIRCELCGIWIAGEKRLERHRGSPSTCQQTQRENAMKAAGYAPVVMYGTTSDLLQRLGVEVRREPTTYGRNTRWIHVPWAPHAALQLLRDVRDVMLLTDWQSRVRDIWHLPKTRDAEIARITLASQALRATETTALAQQQRISPPDIRSEARRLLTLPMAELSEHAQHATAMVLLAGNEVISGGYRKTFRF